MARDIRIETNYCVENTVNIFGTFRSPMMLMVVIRNESEIGQALETVTLMKKELFRYKPVDPKRKRKLLQPGEKTSVKFGIDGFPEGTKVRVDVRANGKTYKSEPVKL